MTPTVYIAAGANRHPAAADWCEDILAFGSDRNIALWDARVRGLFIVLFLIFSTFCFGCLFVVNLSSNSFAGAHDGMQDGEFLAADSPETALDIRTNSTSLLYLSLDRLNNSLTMVLG